MKSLVLHGPAKASGFAVARRSLLRLRSAHEMPVADEDAALVRTEADVTKALHCGYQVLVAIGFDHEAQRDGMRVVELDARFEYLGSGDIIAVDERSSQIRVLWRARSRHNSLLVTERCDHLCLMCSQPPRDVQDGWLIDEIRSLLTLVDPEVTGIGFTGGETLLDWRRFISLLSDVKARLPKAAVHVLTNGRAFARPEVVAAWAGLHHPDLWAGIPIYSAIDTVHDHVVQSRGALDETTLGIMRLKNAGQRVEVRVVLHALTVPRLAQTCTWLARNMPFVDHVALMGMEDTGFALANHASLWMDPLDYGDELRRGIDALLHAGVRTSVYNLPLCVLPTSVRPYAVQSISDWKNAMPESCGPCTERERCPGFFTTGRTKFSRGITPLLPVSASPAPV